MFRFARRLLRPFGRTAIALLAWEHRKSIGMAARSARHEFDVQRRAGLDIGRWKSLATGVWQSREAAERGNVKSVIVDDAQRTVPLTTPPVSGNTSGGDESWRERDDATGFHYSSVG